MRSGLIVYVNATLNEHLDSAEQGGAADLPAADLTCFADSESEIAAGLLGLVTAGAARVELVRAEWDETRGHLVARGEAVRLHG